MRPVVLKFGGELLDDSSRLAAVVEAVAGIGRELPLVIVHGGGKEIDTALATAGLEKRQVDGLRITDEPTLEVVVAVLAGAINTRLVAALQASGVAAVGLTGADADIGRVTAAPPHRTVDGQLVDLGRVGVPAVDSPTTLLDLLVENGFVPVVACIGADADGRLFNVNADTMAGNLAARMRAQRLVVAGATPGVLDPSGSTIPIADASEIERLVSSRTATAGMVAKLRACEQALIAGVDEVVIVDGRDQEALASAALGAPPAAATRLTVEGTERTRGAAYL
jgi:acetylglutamate kinase